MLYFMPSFRPSLMSQLITPHILQFIALYRPSLKFLTFILGINVRNPYLNLYHYTDLNSFPNSCYHTDSNLYHHSSPVHSPAHGIIHPQFMDSSSPTHAIIHPQLMPSFIPVHTNTHPQLME